MTSNNLNLPYKLGNAEEIKQVPQTNLSDLNAKDFKVIFK